MPRESTRPREKHYNCGTCSYASVWKVNVDRHELVHSTSKPYSCRYCNYACNQKQTLNDHERIHTGEKPYECHGCRGRFRTRKQLRWHENQCDKNNSAPVQTFCCVFCEAELTTVQNLLEHMESHHAVG
ncbi:unnamed protein product [Allacma fusca]|uniref:C2H2-type domain-containing protein n=1 Tax=Allacma fusca TaxID=39272 RepID=A0A8J2K8A5_9HEXA|nr:unnamed protein product [Allacma fusca]